MPVWRLRERPPDGPALQEPTTSESPNLKTNQETEQGNTDAQTGTTASNDFKVGNKTVVYDNHGKVYEILYKVVSADSLIVSNDVYGNINENYPKALQPRVV